mmetsp:Transcript_19492/g.62117  ORF Transcript_19492/g.62117 Transcript_19492/m.62117 type:complete len:430 (+) Transcript_19492:30-1319(+)
MEFLLVASSVALLPALQPHAAHAAARPSPLAHRPLLELLKEVPQPCRRRGFRPSALQARLQEKKQRAGGAPRMLAAEVLARSVRPIVGTISLCLAALVPCTVGAFAPGEVRRRGLWRRGFTGFSFAVFVSSWIFSGTVGFLSVFMMFAVVAQNEYYDMVRRNGINPTWKLGLLGSCAMYVAAACPSVAMREAAFPLTGCATIIYLLLRPGFERCYGRLFPWYTPRDTPPTTYDDVGTTFMGVFLFGYMPSFWVRLRGIGPMAPAALLPAIVPPHLRGCAPLVALERSRSDLLTAGALVQWWTMLAIVFADVAAYFVGKKFGRTPLISVSPGKTWEGLWGGVVAATATMAAAAVLLGWPYPLATGGLYGIGCALMGLAGDLTVSLLKRSARVKDTGSIMPGHGGLLDRLDSYLLVAAPAFFYVSALRMLL